MKRIEIIKVGPIEELKLDLDSQFNIIIGKQSIGKSTLVRSINTFKRISYICYDYLMRTLGKVSFEDYKLKISAELCYEIADVLESKLRANESCILFNYTDEHQVKVICDTTGKLKAIFSNKFLNDLEEIYTNYSYIIKEIEKTNLLSEQVSFMHAYNKAWAQLNVVLKEKQCIYIPAERSMANYLAKQKDFSGQTLNNSILTSFIDRVNNARTFLNNVVAKDLALANLNEVDKERIIKSSHLAESLKKDILQGKYLTKDSKDYLVLNNGVKTLLEQASSGQQEIVWILNILEMLMWRNINTTIIIEEPEVNLFPTTQMLVMKYIALFAKTTGSEIIITTHSPYILSSLNMLLYAGENAQYAENIPEILRISPHTIAASFMDNKGCRNIMDDYEIDMRDLDKVSELIWGEIDKIMSNVPCNEVNNE